MMKQIFMEMISRYWSAAESLLFACFSVRKPTSFLMIVFTNVIRDERLHQNSMKFYCYDF